MIRDMKGLLRKGVRLRKTKRIRLMFLLKKKDIRRKKI